MKRVFSFLLVFLLVFSLSGCSGKADQGFTAILPGNVSTLDPQTASGRAANIVIGSLFEGLCRVGEDGEALPGVANRWDHNKDFTTFTFHLRKARWSDGTPVTAQDFVFGVLRALRPETGAVSVDDLFILKNARAIYNGTAEESALGLRVENDRTLVAELEKGYPDFPGLTAGSHYMPCRQEYFEECAGHYGLSAGYLLTNGPFTFPHEYAWDTDYNERSISLTRSVEYRGERKTAAGGLTYLIDYDDTVDADPAAALTSGTTDILELSREEAKAAEELDCRVLALDDAVTGLLLNPEAESLEYIGTRELLIKSLDRADLLALRPEADEALGIMGACVLWDSESYYADGQAQYALQDDEITAGIPSLLELLDLEKVPSITVLCPDDETSIQVANGFLVSWNAKLGNAFNILPLPQDELENRVAQGNYEAALYTLRAGGSSPYDVLRSFESGAFPTLLKDSAFDEALHGLSFDLSSFRELEGSLREQYVFYPLFQEKSYYGLAPGVTGVTVSPDQRIDFSQGRKP